MQGQIEKGKGELIGEERIKTVSVTIKEVSSAGVKIEENFEGVFTGKYDACSMETSTVFMKNDGTLEWENKLMQMTKEGDVIFGTDKGSRRFTSLTAGSAE